MTLKPTQEVRNYVADIEDNAFIKGVHKNPKKLPGETSREFRLRMYQEKQKALGKLHDNSLDAAPERMEQAKAWFIDGIPELRDDKGAIIQNAVKRPTVAEVGLALHLNLLPLMNKSLEQNWEMVRANADAAKELAGGEARLQLAKRVDRAILAKAESVVITAAESYDKLLKKVSQLPDDYTEMTDMDDPSKKVEAVENGTPDEGPRVRTGPKRSRSTLLNTKVGLINDVVKGFMAMCEQARNVGLLVPPQDVKGGTGASTPGAIGDKLNGLNLMLVQIQQGQQPKQEKPVDTAVDV